ncbi:MAG TPA: hypothetical protein VJT13_09580 [Xanthobacteraceae bacterium]|nr:hypothetical protein [Xanthobacteraceae bacterium]
MTNRELEDFDYMTITAAARPRRRHSCKEAPGILVPFQSASPVFPVVWPAGAQIAALSGWQD